MKIVSWNIHIEYEDGRYGYISDLPKYVADAVDEYLTKLEDTQ
jgi:hypothetical protein